MVKGSKIKRATDGDSIREFSAFKGQSVGPADNRPRRIDAAPVVSQKRTGVVRPGRGGGNAEAFVAAAFTVAAAVVCNDECFEQVD